MTESPAVANTALIVAAGRGVRAGGDDLPKQYRPIGGIPVLSRAIERFLGHPAIDRVLVVIGPGDREQFDGLALQNERLLPPVTGGGTRQESVARGLEALADVWPDLASVFRAHAQRAWVSGVDVEETVAYRDAAGDHVPCARP